MPSFQYGNEFEHGNNFQQWLAPFIGKPVKGLEVGSWEGRSALWLFKHIITHPQSLLTVADNWKGEEAQKKMGLDFDLAFKNFTDNTIEYKQTGRLIVWKGESSDVLSDAHSSCLNCFDFCYLDGSHIACDVLSDAIMIWPLLKIGAILIFDDYLWEPVGYNQWHKPKMGIDSFLLTYAEKLKLIAKGYQLCIQKTA